MIINGEKVPAFSATTLSIPASPGDHIDAIIAHSREYFARPRLEVEAEIRATIEQSEKYKKDLSDSGRQEEPKIVINTREKPVFKPVKSEQKPNKRAASTPQTDFRRQKLSPNKAEGRESLGLKDLAKLSGMSEKSKKPEKPEAGKNKKPALEKREPKREKPSTSQSSTPVVPPVENKKTTAVPAPVKPEVEYQEKSVAKIKPSNKPISLSTPIKRTDNYAEKDNSVDGFLAIKH